MPTGISPISRTIVLRKSIQYDWAPLFNDFASEHKPSLKELAQALLASHYCRRQYKDGFLERKREIIMPSMQIVEPAGARTIGLVRDGLWERLHSGRKVVRDEPLRSLFHGV
jgi:hypothetical protein